MSEKLQNVIGKINKLRALAGSTHSKNEAEACLSAAAKLVAEFQIAEAELEAANNASDDPIDLESERILYESGRISQWKSQLAMGLAALNGLFILNAIVRGEKNHRRTNRYRLIGRKSDVDITFYMWDYLLKEISSLADSYTFNMKRGVNPERESFCLGCVRGFVDKMNAEKKAAMGEASSAAMVIMNNRGAEARKAFEDGSNVKLVAVKTVSKAKHYENTYSQGYAQGKQLTVNSALGGASKANKLT